MRLVSFYINPSQKLFKYESFEIKERENEFKIYFENELICEIEYKEIKKHDNNLKTYLSEHDKDIKEFFGK